MAEGICFRVTTAGIRSPVLQPLGYLSTNDIPKAEPIMCQK